MTRALEQLRLMLTSRGVSLSAAALGAALAGEDRQRGTRRTGSDHRRACLGRSGGGSGAVTETLFKVMSF